MSKRYLTLRKRPTASQAPYVMGSPSSRKTEEKDLEVMKKLEEWKALSK